MRVKVVDVEWDKLHRIERGSQARRPKVEQQIIEGERREQARLASIPCNFNDRRHDICSSSRYLALWKRQESVCKDVEAGINKMSSVTP